MAKKHTQLLAISLTEKTVQVAQVRGSGGSATQGKRSSFACDSGLLFESPERWGAQLADHLAREGYTAKHAAVGLSARWILPRVIRVVKTDAAATAGIVRLQIEKDFAGGQGDLVFDYQEAGDRAGQRNLLLVGLPARRLDKIRKAFDAAGLSLCSLSATALDIAAAQNDGLCIVLEHGNATLVNKQAGHCIHCASVACDVEVLSEQSGRDPLARSVARVATTTLGWDRDQADAYLVDAVTLEDARRAQVAKALAQQLGSCDAQPTDPTRHIAQALGQPNSINLLDSRLALRPTRQMPSYAKWLVRAAVLLLLVGGVVGYLWVDANRKRDDLQTQFDAIHDSAQRLEAVHQDTRIAKPWFDDRPAVLDCLLELTHTFPVRGRIWVTGLSLDDATGGVLNCRADDEQTMWRYLHAMSASESLTDVVLRQQDNGGRAETDLVFEVTFTYRRPAQETH